MNHYPTTKKVFYPFFIYSSVAILALIIVMFQDNYNRSITKEWFKNMKDESIRDRYLDPWLLWASGLTLFFFTCFALLSLAINIFIYFREKKALTIDDHFATYYNSSLSLKQISSIETHQSTFGKVFNFGDVIIRPSNNAGSIHAINRLDPLKVKNEIMEKVKIYL
jgi:hypothetical protein